MEVKSSKGVGGKEEGERIYSTKELSISSKRGKSVVENPQWSPVIPS